MELSEDGRSCNLSQTTSRAPERGNGPVTIKETCPFCMYSMIHSCKPTDIYCVNPFKIWVEIFGPRRVSQTHTCSRWALHIRYRDLLRGNKNVKQK